MYPRFTVASAIIFFSVGEPSGDVHGANLIQALADNQPECKLMFCSTSEVYGNVGADRRKINTSDVILPANPYGVSKAATDLYMQERFASKKIRGFITRAFSHTGPRRGRTTSAARSSCCARPPG